MAMMSWRSLYFCRIPLTRDRKSTRLNSSHGHISYAVFCLKKKNTESRGGVPFDSTHDQSRTADSIIFTVRGGQGETHPLDRGMGFLIAHPSYSSVHTEQRH